MKTIEYKGLTIKYDLSALLSEVKSFKYDKDRYHDSLDQIQMKDQLETKKGFNEAKTKFVNELNSLFSDESKLQKALDTVTITKAGLPARNRRQILASSDICTSYDNYYGSHSRTYVAIILTPIEGKLQEIVVGIINVQDSF